MNLQKPDNNNGYVFFKLHHIFEIFLKGAKNTSTQAPKAEQASVLHVNRLKANVRTCFSFGT